MATTECTQVDVAVIGAGPSGTAAAIHAAEAGVDVALIDEHPQAGGAIWRGLANASGSRRQTLLRDYPDGGAMLDRLGAAKLRRIHAATVWEVTRDRVIFYSQAGVARQLAARRIILANGALERPMPFPGWTMPGVLTAGAAQIMLKTSGITPPGPVVMAGSGPLVLLVAAQLLEAGQPPEAIIDTTPRDNWKSALRHLPVQSSARQILAKGLKLKRDLRRAGIPVYRGATDLEALGDGTVSGVRFRHRAHMTTLNCSTLLVHCGVVPNTQISRAIGLDHVWDETGQFWRPHVDDMQRSSVAGILIAGDGGGIAGAEAAVHSGRIAAMAALDGLADVAETAFDHARKALARHMAIRPFLDTFYAPAAEFQRPGNDTIVCRCEEVTAGQIRQLVRQGCHDPNAVKSLGRAGMGPCQGRYCGQTVSHLVAEVRNEPVSDVGYFRLRPPIKPVTLGELASLTPDEARNDG